jgi:hypothetical protein
MPKTATTKSPAKRKPEMCRTVTITGIFGSDLQREIAMKTLTDLLAIWKREVEQRHKKNSISVTGDHAS